MSHNTIESMESKKPNHDPGKFFDQEVAFLTQDYRRAPSKTFNEFLEYIKTTSKRSHERLSEITMKGARDDEDRKFLEECKTDFIDAVNHGDITLD